MLHLYETSTGKLISSASVIDQIPSGMSVKESNKKGAWSTSKLDFDPAPVSKKLTTLEFMGLLTDNELVGILDAAKVNTTIQLFVMKLEQAEFMDLNYQPTINGMYALESAGLLMEGRAQEVLNG